MYGEYQACLPCHLAVDGAEGHHGPEEREHLIGHPTSLGVLSLPHGLRLKVGGSGREVKRAQHWNASANQHETNNMDTTRKNAVAQ